MGYHTNFEGQFNLDRPLTPEHKAYLERFARTRHMLWDESQLPSIPDPVREAAGLPLGLFGIYFTGITDNSISLTHYTHNGRPAYHSALINYNLTPAGVPGLWCGWAPNQDGTAIVWDQREKFYDYIEWLQFLMKHFIGPWGYTLNGSVTWQGEDRADRGTIEVKLNDLAITEEEATEEDESEEEKGPVDYTEALFKMVENTNLQETCTHPYDDIIQVFNVPLQLTITRDTTDWLCSICGEIVPPF